VASQRTESWAQNDTNRACFEVLVSLWGHTQHDCYPWWVVFSSLPTQIHAMAASRFTFNQNVKMLAVRSQVYTAFCGLFISQSLASQPWPCLEKCSLPWSTEKTILVADFFFHRCRGWTWGMAVATTVDAVLHTWFSEVLGKWLDRYIDAFISYVKVKVTL
jgi:hypothetical protein